MQNLKYNSAIYITFLACADKDYIVQSSTDYDKKGFATFINNINSSQQSLTVKFKHKIESELRSRSPSESKLADVKIHLLKVNAIPKWQATDTLLNKFAKEALISYIKTELGAVVINPPTKIYINAHGKKGSTSITTEIMCNEKDNSTIKQKITAAELADILSQSITYQKNITFHLIVCEANSFAREFLNQLIKYGFDKSCYVMCYDDINVVGTGASTISNDTYLSKEYTIEYICADAHRTCCWTQQKKYNHPEVKMILPAKRHPNWSNPNSNKRVFYVDIDPPNNFNNMNSNTTNLNRSEMLILRENATTTNNNITPIKIKEEIYNVHLVKLEAEIRTLKSYRHALQNLEIFMRTELDRLAPHKNAREKYNALNNLYDKLFTEGCKENLKQEKANSDRIIKEDKESLEQEKANSDRVRKDEKSSKQERLIKKCENASKSMSLFNMKTVHNEVKTILDRLETACRMRRETNLSCLAKLICHSTETEKKYKKFKNFYGI